MNAICTRTYANIFMASFELKFIYPSLIDETKMFLTFHTHKISDLS